MSAPCAQRVLVNRPEQGVVADQDRPEALGSADLFGDLAQQPDVDQRVGRIGRSLDQDHRHAALAFRLLRRGADR